MNKFMNSVKNFLVSEDGPTAVEYAVMLALIIVVCIGTVTTIGTKANAKFQRRFEAVERIAHARGIDVRTAGLDVLDPIWDEVKASE